MTEYGRHSIVMATGEGWDSPMLTQWARDTYDNEGRVSLRKPRHSHELLAWQWHKPMVLMQDWGNGYELERYMAHTI
jgi:hypothetical protein